jgi:hypothetical protein
LPGAILFHCSIGITDSAYGASQTVDVVFGKDPGALATEIGWGRVDKV